MLFSLLMSLILPPGEALESRIYAQPNRVYETYLEYRTKLQYNQSRGAFLWHRLGLKAAIMSNRFEQAEALLRKLSGKPWIDMVNETPGAFLSDLGVLFRRTGDNRLAIQVYQCAIGQADADTVVTLINLAVVLKKSGQYDKALTRLKQAQPLIEKATHEAAFHNNLGNVYAELKDHPKALIHLRKAYFLRTKLGNLAGQIRTGLNLLDNMIQAANVDEGLRLMSSLQPLVERQANPEYNTVLLWQGTALKVLSGEVLSEAKRTGLITELNKVPEARHAVIQYAPLLDLQLPVLNQVTPIDVASIDLAPVLHALACDISERG